MSSKYVEVPSDESGIPTYRQQTFKQKYLSGVKRTLRAFTAVAVVVLIINVCWLVYAKAKYGIVDGYGTIRKGECKDVKQLNTWLHLVINILSTLLLTGSNAFMACFSCPSREEVDQAHAKNRSLHIGVLSFGNLRGIAKRKSLVVLLLALSSIPFHLLYNSLVFSSLSSNEYYWTIVSENFLSGAAYNLTGDWERIWPGQSYSFTRPEFSATPPSNEFGDSLFHRDAATYMHQTDVMNSYYDNIQNSAPKWERLENAECINAYSNLFLTSRRNVVLVSSASNSSVTNSSNSVLKYGQTDFDNALDENWWICSMTGQDGGNLFCNPRSLTSDAKNWKVFDYPIEYCLSEPKESICAVQFSMTIMWVVIGFNSLKVLAMVWILISFDAQKLLASVGDAAASFLTHDDPTTLGMCLADKRSIRSFWQSRGQPRLFSFNRRRWGGAVSTGRWVLFMLLMTFAFLLIVIFAGWGFAHIKTQGVGFDLASLWSLGFGATNQNTMVLADNNVSGAVLMAVLANLPQVILAGIYLVYLGIMNSMFIAADWSKFAFKKQTLMVSSAVGEQRGTWLLGAPLGFGIGLISLHTLLHWFVSQSIFVVQIEILNKDGTPDDNQVLSNCGYSPIAIIFSVVAAVILLLSALITMMRRFPAGAPPVASTSSAAISAACHPIRRWDGLVYQELMWGVNGGYGNGVEHCSLTSAEAWNTGSLSATRPGIHYS